MSKTILVTGVTGDIGFAVVQALLDENYNVIGLCRTVDKVSEEIRYSDQLKLYEIDLEDVSSIKGKMQAIIREVGSIDGFVSCAGIEITKPLMMLSVNDYNRIFAINVFSNLEILKILSHPKAIGANGSSVVLISSLAAREGAVGKSIYGSSKRALDGLLLPLGAELQGRDIRLNTVVPGIVDAGMTTKLLEKLDTNQRERLLDSYPKGFVEVKDVVSAILFLLSDASKSIVSQEIVIDRGHSLV